MSRKYPIDKQFGFFAKFKPPFFGAMLPLGRLATGGMWKELKRHKNVNFCKHNVGGVEVVAISPVGQVGKLPCLVYLHGGAFVFDGSFMHYRLAVQYAVQCNCVVAFVRYGLAPKHKHPTQIEQCFNVLQWVANGGLPNADCNHVAVAGDSAGGFLCANVVQLACQNSIKLHFQMLIYPVVDCDMSTPSMKSFCDTPMWNSELNAKMWKWYLGKGGKAQSLLSQSVHPNTPPTFVEVCQFDCLHDEGLYYAQMLQNAGACVEISQNQGLFHGFEIVDCPTTRQIVQRRVAYVNKMWQREQK